MRRRGFIEGPVSGFRKDPRDLRLIMENDPYPFPGSARLKSYSERSWGDEKVKGKTGRRQGVRKYTVSFLSSRTRNSAETQSGGKGGGSRRGGAKPLGLRDRGNWVSAS